MDTNTYYNYNTYNLYVYVYIYIFHLPQKSLMPFSGPKFQSEMVCHTTAMDSHELSLKFIKITSQHIDIAWSIPITKQIFKHFQILFSSLLPMGWIPVFNQTANSSQPHIFHVRYKPIFSFHCLHHGPQKRHGFPWLTAETFPDLAANSTGSTLWNATTFRYVIDARIQLWSYDRSGQRGEGSLVCVLKLGHLYPNIDILLNRSGKWCCTYLNAKSTGWLVAYQGESTVYWSPSNRNHYINSFFFLHIYSSHWTQGPWFPYKCYQNCYPFKGIFWNPSG